MLGSVDVIHHIVLDALTLFVEVRSGFHGDVAAFDTGPFQRGHDFGNEFFPFAQWRLLRDGDAVCRSENRHIAGIGCCAGL